MTIDIVSMGNLKKDNGVRNELTESWMDYQDAVKNIIRKHCHPNTRNWLLKSDDALANITTNVMMGDWRFDQSRVGNATKFFLRVKHVIWAIKSMHGRQQKKFNFGVGAIEATVHPKTNIENEVLGAKEGSPPEFLDMALLKINMEDKKLIKVDNKDYLDTKLTQLYNRCIISKDDIDCIWLKYRDNMNYREISEIKKQSQEWIRQRVLATEREMQKICKKEEVF